MKSHFKCVMFVLSPVLIAVPCQTELLHRYPLDSDGSDVVGDSVGVDCA